MLAFIMTSAFFALTLVPQTLLADSTISNCLATLQKQWPNLSDRILTGETRHKTKCQLEVEILPEQMSLRAEGPPLDIQFTLGSNQDSLQTIHQCKIDKEKIHIVFEDVGSGKNEKHEKVQLTLLKRQGPGWSMILSQRKLKVFQHTQQNNLICHLK